MTENSPSGHIIRYALPLMLSSALQLFYNLADGVIAGRFIGREALAATGIAGPVMNLIILSISGLTVGSSVLMSAYYGARDEEKLKKAFSTLLLFGLAFSAIITIIGLALTRRILLWANTPDDILDMSASYLGIIFLSVPFTYFYNALSASLKSVGDSATPLKFLLFSSTLNLALDLVLIGLLGFGIRCNAITTVVATAASALLAFFYIMRRVGTLRLSRKELSLDKAMLSQILSYGSITALQQAVQPVGKIMIQSAVNSLGVDVIAAYNAVTKIDDFALTPEQSIGAASTTFTSQNLGARKEGRIRQGLKTTLTLEVIYGAFIGLIVFFLKDIILTLFADRAKDPLVIAEGVKYLGTMSFFYILPALTNGMQGFMRGMGKMRITLISTAIQVTVRVIFTYALINGLGIRAISIACALGWALMMAFEYPYAYACLKKRKRAEA